MPPGRCYETAFWYLMNWGNPDMLLCHGIPVQDIPPYSRYGHAWLEQGNRVIEVADGNPRIAVKIIYYRKSGIDPALIKRYTQSEARELALKFRHYGPWDPVIAAAAHHRDKRAREA